MLQAGALAQHSTVLGLGVLRLGDAGADFNAGGNINPDDLGDYITACFGQGC